MKTAADRKASLRKIFEAAVNAASPYAAVRANLRLVRSPEKSVLKVKNASVGLKKGGRVFVIGAGKGAPSMARAVEGLLGNRISGGLVVTKYGHSLPLKRIEVMEAGHPIPDRNGLLAAERMIKTAEGAGEDDLVIFLLTGGASALLPAPADGITLKEKQAISRLLINSGASINEINAVRKHLSRLKGGRLAELAWPARVLTLIVSDVVGNDLSSIGSGPTAPDPSTFEDCIRIIGKYGLSARVPAKALKLLSSGVKRNAAETPKPGHRAFARTANIILADNFTALLAAKEKAASLGFRPIILSSAVTGNTREAARLFSSVLMEIRRSGNPVRPPACVLMGGETTLRVAGKGKGGRNQEFALCAALALGGEEGISILSAGTDGTDGPTDAAGAFALPDTLRKASVLGLDASGFLSRNDSYNFFKPIGGLFMTGPTGTNVMDIAIGISE
ncbi:MAG: glycerate kinase [Candidatus Methylomirabilis sp.]|nr:glycerate kinase [Deltaproteobacteria bacterium]